jgi:subtilisin family serine protease
VRPAKGRAHLSFHTRKDERGDTHVLPEDALALVSKGKLDPRLFDVSALVRAGYDDASRSTLPLIVDFPGKTPRLAGARVSRELPVMGAAAVSVERSADFWATARNAEHVWLDGPVRMSLDYSVAQIAAPAAWAAGHTGAGTTVAVLDSGIDTTHPDLSDAVVDAVDFSGSGTVDDRAGHGTHVASTITGNGARYKGVAPDAKLLNGKVLNDNGQGAESWIITGMEWAAGSGADVVNVSLGGFFPSDGTDPLDQAVNRITAESGALFVVAAGNTGGQVSSPAAADAALTVGAVDRDDQLADFSSRGRMGGGIKPDITAPGVDIVAAKAKNGHLGTPVEDGYVSMPGTSMATPHVAGAAAILAGQHPEWQADQLKAALMGTAEPTDGLTVFEQGAGRVNVAKASAATVFSSPGSLNVGTVQWPHHDDQPIANTVTYTNTTKEPVTLDLAADLRAADGSVAPAGMFTLTPARLTVPAGGRSSATLTTDLKVEGPDGVYGGVVTATGAGQPVRTPVAANREVESYDVALSFVDLNGSLTDIYNYRFVDVNNRVAHYPYDPSGKVVVRLPKSEYYLEATVQTPKSERGYRNAEFTEPAFVVDGPRSLVLDAREAQPVGLTVDRPNARIGAAMFSFELTTTWGETGVFVYAQNFDDIRIKPATTTKKDLFTFTAEARMAEWNGTSFDGTPYLYHVRHTDNGTVPSGLSWTFRDRQLARVRGEHAAATPGMVGFREGFLTVSLPTTLTEYYTPDVPWEGQFEEVPAPWETPVSAVYQIEPVTYRLGRTTTVRWNAGVHGPALPKSSWSPTEFAGRSGDVMTVDIPMATDQGRGRRGFLHGPGATTLLRDGAVVGEGGYPGLGRFVVKPERAEYTLRTTGTRPSARLSTRIDAEWTFTSEHAEEDTALPLLAVRFAPDLDAENAARAGKRFTIPVFVERNGGPLGNVRKPVVEVSYDDGATWRPAPVTANRGEWKAVVDHPRGAEFVSLRSSVSDPDGNSQRQTIIRAYALK